MATLTPILIMAGRFILASALMMALYWVVWRKQGTYRAKRIYLLSLPVVALAISLVQMEVYKQAPIVIEVTEAPAYAAEMTLPAPAVAQAMPEAESGMEQTAPVVAAEEEALPLSETSIVTEKFLASLPLIAYTFIIMVLCLPLLFNVAQLRRLGKRGKVEENDTLGCRIVTNEAVKAPFSFHRTVYLPQTLTEAQRRMILCHELSHIRHFHYRDVWVIEAITRLFWWNPVLWWTRKELRNVHEFEADSDVLATGEDVFAYQTILIEEVMHGDVVIANGFNHSFIRRRFIEMIKSSNRRMTTLGKAGSTAWILLVAATMCCTVGEAETVYRVTSESATSDELQATSDELQATSEGATSEEVKDSTVPHSVSIVQGKATVDEAAPDSMFTNFFSEAEKEEKKEEKREEASPLDQIDTRLGRIVQTQNPNGLRVSTRDKILTINYVLTDSTLKDLLKEDKGTQAETRIDTTDQYKDVLSLQSGIKIPEKAVLMGDYKKRSDAASQQQYARLSAATQQAQAYRQGLIKRADKGELAYTEVETLSTQYAQGLFSQYGITLKENGGYILPDQTLVVENGDYTSMNQRVEYGKRAELDSEIIYNTAPIMERDKSPNYSIQNEHTWPIYTQVCNNVRGPMTAVYRGKGCTYVVELSRVPKTWEWLWCYHNSRNILVDPLTGNTYKMLYVEHFPTDTYYWIHGQAGETICHVKVFEELPEDVTLVDYVSGFLENDKRLSNMSPRELKGGLTVHTEYKHKLMQTP